MALTYDAQALRALASAVYANFVGVFGESVRETHPGALWYFSKYFTPHPPGEPHFFVKPWALTRVPAGWSLVVDGCHGRDYDIIRGVIQADQFGATPAVFQVFTLGQRIVIPAEQPLIYATPQPRALALYQPDVQRFAAAPLA